MFETKNPRLFDACNGTNNVDGDNDELDVEQEELDSFIIDDDDKGDLDSSRLALDGNPNGND
ncbi:hypothetical protein [Aeromonas veronii]|uniref:hypothetical protein n=1 Tax=Aeromonas veronii TaxID=654 RepID=UPI003D22E464